MEPTNEPAKEGAELPRPVYPAIEAFIEAASADQVTAFFAPLKEGLAALKGPRMEQAKKVQTAIQCTERLLLRLLEIREKIETSEGQGP